MSYVLEAAESDDALGGILDAHNETTSTFEEDVTLPEFGDDVDVR